ncbi:uncharacterized protein [Battus philenor]|uniref:uncharacterized protein n=1 Tax=Battus philenor TaxID=42288 RepID=UPI0035D0195A
MYFFLFFLYAVVTTVALPVNTTYSENFAVFLNEDEFEDYLDALLERRYKSISHTSHRSSGCTIQVNGDLGVPQPVYIYKNDYLTPIGNTGAIQLRKGEEVTIACTGSKGKINHPNIFASVDIGTARCESNAYVTGPGWLEGKSAFVNLTCSSNSDHNAVLTSDRCFNNNVVIRVGYTVNNIFYPLYWSCFDQKKLEVLYVWYDQNPSNAIHQVNVERPSWKADKFFPGVDINKLYTINQQRLTIENYLGYDLANKYVTNSQYLSRGHLAAKTDFIYATGQRATFYFINSAPQWQSFNNGNWNGLEQSLRTRIGDAGYNTIVYSGTYGVLQLLDEDNNLIDIYLNPHRNDTRQVPVPLYYYKVVHDRARRLGTAFIGINNPHITLNEAHRLQFCKDQCRNNSAFNWLRWQPDVVTRGYSFCCSIQDFRRTVPHLPAFTVDGLLS